MATMTMAIGNIGVGAYHTNPGCLRRSAGSARCRSAWPTQPIREAETPATRSSLGCDRLVVGPREPETRDA